MRGEERQTILIVDDGSDVIDLLRGILEPEYKIKVALNGERALQIASAATKPDMILLDVIMPVMDGYEVCKRLKADHTTNHIPIIFITGKIALKDEILGLEMGAVDYITKPISPPIVLARVRTQLAIYDQNRELDRKVRDRTEQLHQTRLEIIQRLGRAAEYKDNETGMHVIRMSNYSRVLAIATGMSARAAELLMNAAPMHDIGKIGIPDHILTKPGKLDDDEFDVMRTHCKIGARIIGDDTSKILQVAKVVAMTHHEKWDGSGYPNKLKGDKIPRIGCIVAVADVFDALTTVRPYKEAWSVEDAVNFLEVSAGSHFDPRLIPLFVESLPEIIKIKKTYTERGIT